MVFNVFMQTSVTHAVMSCINTMTSLLYSDITAERASLLTTYKSDALMYIGYIKIRCKITCLKQLCASSVNRLTGNYFFSVTCYGLLANFKALKLGNFSNTTL